MKRRKGWVLPVWMPYILRAFILTFEPFDEPQYESDCKVIAVQRWGVYALDGDWMIVAAELMYKSAKEAVSPQWLAAQQAGEE